MASNDQTLLKNQAGFTLVEVMIAITILSFISYLTYAMVDANMETKDRVTKEDKQIVQSLATIARIETDFSQLYTPLFFADKAKITSNPDDYGSSSSSASNSTFDGTSTNGNLIPQIKSEEKSTLIFLSSSNRRKYADSKESRFAWIKYSLMAMPVTQTEGEEASNQGLFNLVRQTINGDIYTTELNWDEARSVVMLGRVKELEFSFWNERSKKFTTSITELNELRNSLRSIQVKMTYIDDVGNEQKITKVFRVLYPYFNPKADQVNQTNQTGQQTTQETGSQTATQDDEEVEDE